MTQPIAPSVGERSSTRSVLGFERADARRTFAEFDEGTSTAGTNFRGAFSAFHARKLPGNLFAKRGGSPAMDPLGPRTAKSEFDPTQAASREMRSPGEAELAPREAEHARETRAADASAEQSAPASPSEASSIRGARSADPEPQARRASRRAGTRATEPAPEHEVSTEPRAGSAIPGIVNLSQKPAGTEARTTASVIGGSGASSRLPTVGVVSPQTIASREARQARPTASARRPNNALTAQMTRGITSTLRHGGGAVTLHLRPAALGAMRIRVEVREGTVSARFETSTPEARRLLGEHLPMLKAALEARGLSVERLAVEDDLAMPRDGSAPEGLGLDPDGSGDGPGTDAHDEQDPASETAVDEDACAPEEPGDAPTPPVRADGGVDALA